MKAYGFCKLCKKCCVSKTVPARIWVSKNELELIRKETGKDIKAEQEKGSGLYIISHNKNICQFLGPNGCVLKHKPITCVMYPFKLIGSDWVLRLQCPNWDKIKEKDFMEMLDYFEKHKEDWGAQK
jgi:Fe-S-cluster containining protein